MDLIQTFKEILAVPNARNDWRSFFIVNVYIFVLITLLDGSIGGLFHITNPFILKHRIIILLATYALPYIFYIPIFFINRNYEFKIALSKKTKIVIAYNTESISSKNFPPKYKSFIKKIENEINLNNLGGHIKIIECPPDIKIKEQTFAEAKTKLGRLGSTIIVWGYIDKVKKGKYEFRTKFSYEYAYRKLRNVEDRKAAAVFNHYIGQILSASSFNVIKADVNEFSDQLIPMVLFILGVSTSTLGFFDESELFFQSFRKLYKSMDLSRQNDLKAAFQDVNSFLIGMYIAKITKLTNTLKTTNKYDELRDGAEKILEIDNRNYEGNNAMAYYFEHQGIRNEAIEFHRKAEQNSPKNRHEHLVNQAYFHIHNGEYAEALKIYENIPDRSNVEMMEVCKDLYHWYLKTKNSAFLFAEGYISYRWIGADDGKNILKAFLSENKNEDKYRIFTNKAEELIA